MLGFVGQMVGDPLQEAEEVVVEAAVDRGPGQDRDGIARLQLGLCRRHPVARGLAVDGLVQAEQRAAQLAVLLGQDHPRAGLGGGERGGEPGRPGAHHQHITVRIGLVVAVRIAAVGTLPMPALWRIARSYCIHSAAGHMKVLL